MTEDSEPTILVTAGVDEIAAFGRSLHVDFYDVSPSLCDDLSFCYDLLDHLPLWLGMQKQSPPFIFRSPLKEFSDKAGLSGWVPLIQSGISIHTLTANKFVTLDIYTCGTLNTQSALEYLCGKLGTCRYEYHYLVRGQVYKKT